jgi:hypothetical protein
MIITAILGFMIGLSPTPTIESLSWVLYYIVGLSVFEIVIKKNPITGNTSPYVYYLENLLSIGKRYRFPAIAYTLKAIVISLPIGAATFFVARLVF